MGDEIRCRLTATIFYKLAISNSGVAYGDKYLYAGYAGERAKRAITT